MELTQARVRELFDYREDGNLVWKQRPSNRIKIGDVAGFRRKTGYLEIRVDGTLYLGHRLIFLFNHGWLPEEVDHQDNDQFNNRIGNLRPATSSQNKCNRGKEDCNTSGYKGVWWHQQIGRWRATIAVNGKKKHLGSFQSAEDASKAYQEAAKRLHGDFARF
jgi:hypothetical protein